MRISDWSSDVCSSDLIQLAILQPAHGPYRGILLWTTRSWCATECSAWQCMQMTVLACMDLAQRLLGFRDGQNYPPSIRGRAGGRASVGAGGPGPEPEYARKIVVSGKSVSVCVDLGGSRMM